VLQVRSGTLLQVGDHNRTYTVELACVAIPEGGNPAATEWLRAALPRRTKVNLRPVGNDGGTLVARVQRLGTADAAGGSTPDPDGSCSEVSGVQLPRIVAAASASSSSDRPKAVACESSSLPSRAVCRPVTSAMAWVWLLAALPAVDWHRWQPPSWPYIQPYQDAQADALLLSSMLSSPRRVHQQRGMDFTEVAAEAVAGHELDLGLAGEDGFVLVKFSDHGQGLGRPHFSAGA
jgi:hypothetical protein